MGNENTESFLLNWVKKNEEEKEEEIEKYFTESRYVCYCKDCLNKRKIKNGNT